MKLARFRYQDRQGIGIVDGKTIIDCSGAHASLQTIPDILQAGEAGRRRLQALADDNAPRYQLDKVDLLAPIPRPGKFLCVGLNYMDHIEETGAKQPEYPKIFNKQITCVNGPGAHVDIPRVSGKVDYEGELGMVIGRRCRHVSREQAPEVIGGYLIVNDVSVRDWQVHSSTWTMGKSFDTHGPTGPWLVTADEIGDPHRLDVKTWVNEDLRQDTNTRHLLFTCYYLVEYLSTAFTLEPGDIIATGTSGGVGFKMDPPAWLKDGDTVRIEIEDIGVLENRFGAESEDSAFIE
jgi:2-keto-4-pentenoate hydratase/2-oxohepta-3-ene-1,7-dioic acid hydratase in catechol pathway